MGDVRSLEDDVEAPPGPSSPLCRASYFPIIRMCSRRTDRASTSSPVPRHGDDDSAMTADGLPAIDRRAVRDRNGRILFYYAPLPRRDAVNAGQAVACRVSLCKSRSAGEILSTSPVAVAVNKSRFAVPLQVRRRQLDDIRRRLAALDVDDDDHRGDSCCEPKSDTWRGASPEDRISGRRRSTDDADDDDERDKHRKQRRQRLQQAVSVLTRSCADAEGPDIRRGGSVESDSGSRSDRDCSTDGSASGSTDTDHDHASITVSYVYNSTIHRIVFSSKNFCVGCHQNMTGPESPDRIMAQRTWRQLIPNTNTHRWSRWNQ